MYVFKIKITDGWYYDGCVNERVIEVPENYTLHELCMAILDAYDFDRAHMYDFILRGTMFEYESCSNIKLSGLSLKPRNKLKLHYDYGDDWMFDVSLSKINDDKQKTAKILSSTGTIEQYPQEDLMFEEDNIDTAESFDMPLDFDYVPDDSLFEAAFKYKKTKLWKSLFSEEVFAVRFSDGLIGYISIMGNVGTHNAVGIYVGNEGYESLCKLIYSNTSLSEFEMMSSQSCIQVVFDDKEYLLPRELDNAKTYAKKKGLKLSGKNAYPHFIKYEPYYFMWHPDQNKDTLYIREALEACEYLSNMLKKATPFVLGIKDWNTNRMNELYCINISSGKVIDTQFISRPVIEDRISAPTKLSDISCEKIKKNKTKCEFELKLTFFEDAVRDSDDEPPFYPQLLIFINRNIDKMSTTRPQKVTADSLNLIASDFLDQLCEAGIRPTVFHVSDNKTYDFLKPIAEKISVKIIKYKTPLMIDTAVEEMKDSMSKQPEDDMMSPAEVLEMIDSIYTLPSSFLKTMPEDLHMALIKIYNAHIVDQATENKIKIILNKLK